MFKENGRAQRSEFANKSIINNGRVLKCEQCKKKYHVDSIEFGEVVRCPECNGILKD